MALLEFSTERRLRREEVAAHLRRLADPLERHDDLEFELDGLRCTVDVPDDVGFDVELELWSCTDRRRATDGDRGHEWNGKERSDLSARVPGDDGNELEIEITW